MASQPARKTKIEVDVVVSGSQALQKANKQVDELIKRSKGADKSVQGTSKAMAQHAKATDGARKATEHINKSNSALGKSFIIANKQVEQATKATAAARKAYRGTSKEVQNMTKAVEGVNKSTRAVNKTVQNAQKSTQAYSGTVASATKNASAFTKNMQGQNRTLKETNKVTQLIPRTMRNVTTSTQIVSKSVGQMSGQLIDASKRFGQTAKSSDNMNVNMEKILRTNTMSFRSFQSYGEMLGMVSRQYDANSRAASQMAQKVTRSGWDINRSMDSAAQRSGFLTQKFASTRDAVSRGVQYMASETRRNVGIMNNAFTSIPTTFGPIASSIARNVQNSIMAPFRSATGVVSNFAATMGLLSAGSLVNSGLDRLSSIENAKVSLEVMMGGEEEAQRFMDDILDFAKTTPFAFDKLAETSRNLYAFGMDEQNIIPTMKAIGDAAAASGKGAAGLDQIAGAFGDMQVAGTLSLDQINRLQTAGVPALKILANQAGISTDEMRKQISSGTMSSVQAIQDLVQGMQEGTDGIAGQTAAMAGIMEKTKDTWTGTLDTMRSTVRSTMANLMTPIKPHLQSGMLMFADAFSKLPGMFEALGKALQPAVEPVKLAFANISNFVTTALIPVLQMLWEALSPSVKLIGTMLVGAIVALSSVLNSIIGPLFRFIAGMDGLVPILAGVIAAVIAYQGVILAAAAAEKVANAVKIVSTNLTKAHTRAQKGYVRGGKGVTGMIVAHTMAMRSLNLSMLANPVVLLTMAIVGLGVGLYAAYKRSESFRNAIDSLFGSIASFVKGIPGALKSAWDATRAFFMSMGSAIATAFADGFVPGLQKVGSAVFDGGVSIASAIGSGIGHGLRNTGAFFSSLGESIKIGTENAIASVSSTFSSVGERIAGFITTGMATSVQRQLSSGASRFTAAGSRISDWISAGLSSRAGEIVRSFFSQLSVGFSSVTGFASILAPTIATIGLGLMGVTGPIGFLVGGILSVIGFMYRLSQTNEAVAATFANVFEFLKTQFQLFAEQLSPITDVVNQAFGEMAAELGPEFQKTLDVMAESINQLKPTFAELGAAFSEVASAFVGMFAELWPVFEQIGAMYIEFQMELWAAVGELLTTILPMIADAITQIVPIVALVVSGIAEVIMEVLPLVVEFIGMLMPLFTEIITAVLPLFLEVFTNIFAMVLDVVMSVLPFVILIISALIPLIMEIVSAVLPMLLEVAMMVFPMIATLLSAIMPIIVEIISSIIPVVMEIVSAVLPMLLDIIQAVFPFLLTIVQTVLPIVISFISMFMDILLELIQNVLPVIMQVVEIAFPIIANIIKVAMDIVIAVLQIVMWILINVLVPAINLLLQVIQYVFPIIADIIENALNIAIGILNFFTSLFTGDLQGMWEAVKEIFLNAIGIVWNFLKLLFVDKIVGAIVDFALWIWEKIKEMWENVKTAFNDGIQAAIQFIVDMVANIVNKWNEFKSSIATLATELWDSIKNHFSTGVSNAIQFIVDMKDGIVKKWNDIKDSVTELAKGLWEIVEGRFNDMVEGAKALPGKIADGIKSMGYKALEGIINLGNSMQKGLADVVNGVIDGINNVLGKLGIDTKIPKWNPPLIKVPEYARGTASHPGGPAILGDGGGPELFRTPSGYTGLSPGTDTLMNLPKGTQVLSHTETKQYMRQVPEYAKGTKDKGLFGYLKDAGASVWETGKKIGGAVKQTAVDVWEMISDPGKILQTILSGLGIELPNISGAFGDLAGGLFNKFKDAALSFITRKTSELDVGGDGGYGWGAPFRMTSPFGMRTHPITGKRTMHTGVDWAAPAGTPIPAQAAGKVSFAGIAGGYGNLVRIVSGMYERYYAHNLRNLVKKGDSVAAGQTIGLTGSTGRSTGPHVHYEVRKNGVPIDPNSVAAGGGSASGTIKQWIHQAIAATGVPQSWLGPLSTIAQKESGGNPRAVNNWDINAKRGTPSKGLMQTIGPTFNAFKMPGMGDIFNPVHNTIAAIRYIQRRYGTVFNTPGIRSMRSGGPYRGYYTGGRVFGNQYALVGEQGPELMKLHGGARIYNARKTKQMIESRHDLTSSVQSDYGNSTVSRPAANVNYSPTVNIEIKGDTTENLSVSKIKQVVDEALTEAMTKWLEWYNPDEVF